MRKKYLLYVAGIATLFGLGGVGYSIIFFFHDITWHVLFFEIGYDIWFQIVIGLIYGLISSGILIFVLRRKFLHPTKIFFASLMQRFQVTFPDILFLSFCAGVGEEILFRGAIQEWLGVWITSIIFIFAHGYLNPKDKPLFIYGVILFFICNGFGYLYQYLGIWTAISAHFIIDVLLMMELKHKANAKTLE